MAPKPKINRPDQPFLIKTPGLPAGVMDFIGAHTKLLSGFLTGLIGLLILAYIAQLSSAATTDFGQTVLPAAGTITVTAPNGGESWTVDTVQNITWDSTGDIDNVLIELQREPAGAWEELVATTPDDGTYPWTVAGAATSTASIRVTKVTDNAILDTSNAVFSIVAAAAEGGSTTSSGSIARSHPGINNLFYTSTGEVIGDQPVYNHVDQLLSVEGFNFDAGSQVFVGGQRVSTRFVGSTRLEILLSKGFAVGNYEVTVVTSANLRGTWGRKLQIALSPSVIEQPMEIDGYTAQLVRKSPDPRLEPGETAILWVEFRNMGNVVWRSDGAAAVRLATSRPKDRQSVFMDSSWITVTRPAAVATEMNSTPAAIAPGEIGRFQFVIRAPQAAQLYREQFGLTVGNGQWFWDEGLVWNIQVGDENLNLRDVVARPIDSDPADPTAGSPTDPNSTADSAADGSPGLMQRFLNFLAQTWYWFIFGAAIYGLVAWQLSLGPNLTRKL